MDQGSTGSRSSSYSIQDDNKMRVPPAKYQEKTNDYKCVICGWQGYPDVTGGWCQMSEIFCPKCGIDVTIEEAEEVRPKQDLRGYFI